MTKRWFAKDATGVNSDLERHRRQEAELRELIANADTDQLKKSYQNLLNMLLDSKARVAIEASNERNN